MIVDIQKLKSAADSIQSEEWGVNVADVCRVYEADGTKYVQCWSKVAECTDVDIAKFIAAANPAAVLELIAEIERLRSDKAYAEVWEKARAIQSEMDELLAERDQLNTENTDLHATLQAAKGEIERLKGENEALRKDLELSDAGRARIVGAMSRLRAKHNDWSPADLLPGAMSKKATHD